MSQQNFLIIFFRDKKQKEKNIKDISLFSFLQLEVK